MTAIFTMHHQNIKYVCKIWTLRCFVWWTHKTSTFSSPPCLFNIYFVTETDNLWWLINIDIIHLPASTLISAGSIIMGTMESKNRVGWLYIEGEENQGLGRESRNRSIGWEMLKGEARGHRCPIEPTCMCRRELACQYVSSHAHLCSQSRVSFESSMVVNVRCSWPSEWRDFSSSQS